MTSSSNKPFNEAFKEIYPTLVKRYSIKREVDCLNEFIQFADNTRNPELMDLIYEEIKGLTDVILLYITNYEQRDKEDID